MPKHAKEESELNFIETETVFSVQEKWCAPVVAFCATLLITRTMWNGFLAPLLLRY